MKLFWINGQPNKIFIDIDMMPGGSTPVEEKPEGDADFDDEKNAPFGTNDKRAQKDGAPKDI